MQVAERFDDIVEILAATTYSNLGINAGNYMKLLRFGPSGAEKPGMMDSAGSIRDLSSIINDIDGTTLGADQLAKIAQLIRPAFLQLILPHVWVHRWVMLERSSV